MSILYGAVIGGKLYRIDTVTGVETVVGDGVDRSYIGVAVDSLGNLYASTLDGNIYKFHIATGTLTRTYVTGEDNSRAISIDSTLGKIYLGSMKGYGAILTVDMLTGAVTYTYGTGNVTDVEFSPAFGFTVIDTVDCELLRGTTLATIVQIASFGADLQAVCTRDENLTWVSDYSRLYAVSGALVNLHTYTGFGQFWGIAIDGDLLFVAVTGGKILSRSSDNIADDLTPITSTNRDWQDICTVPVYIPSFQILAPCTLQMLCDSKVANSSSGRRRTVSRDSSFVFSATLNLPSECEQFESVPYYNFPVIGDCEIRQLDLVKYTFRDTEKTSSVKCVIVPNIMQKRTGDFRISCEPNISMDEAMLVATGSSSLEVLSSSRALSLKCVWTVSFLAATQFIEWLRGSVNRIFTTSVGGMKGVACQIGDSVSLEIGSTDVKISADLAIVNTKQFPLNVTASRVGNVVTVSTGAAYIGTLVNRSGEIVEVVATATNVLTFTTYPENCYLLIREGHIGVLWHLVPGSNVTEWLEL